MKKLLLIFVLLFSLVGCKSNQDKVEIGQIQNKETVEKEPEATLPAEEIKENEEALGQKEEIKGEPTEEEVDEFTLDDLIVILKNLTRVDNITRGNVNKNLERLHMNNVIYDERELLAPFKYQPANGHDLFASHSFNHKIEDDIISIETTPVTIAKNEGGVKNNDELLDALIKFSKSDQAYNEYLVLARFRVTKEGDSYKIESLNDWYKGEY